MREFYFQCTHCAASFGLRAWFAAGQCCRACGVRSAKLWQGTYLEKLYELVCRQGGESGLWRYFDLLPVTSRTGIISCGESHVPIERWRFLEEIAARKGLQLKVYGHRFDLSLATNTFKDIAASLALSVYREHGIERIALASTGNIGVAYARYAGEAGIELTVFVPDQSEPVNGTFISALGQRIHYAGENYASVKQAAVTYAQKRGVTPVAFSHDPLRLEAKKTLPYEWRRRLPEFPTVYLQALSGGTTPLGVTGG